MARTEAEELTGTEPGGELAPDLAIALALPADPGALRSAIGQALQRTSPLNGASSDFLTKIRISVSVPVSPGLESSVAGAEPPFNDGMVRFVPVALPSHSPDFPLMPAMADYEPVISWTRGIRPSAVVFVASDLMAVKSGALEELAAPLIESRSDLVLPIYPTGKFESLLNSAILAPLTRALYGARVRFPLAPDFGISSRLLAQIEQRTSRIANQANSLFWPATAAALHKQLICQAYVRTKHAPADGLDLSAVIARTVGPLFADAEANAAEWQRVHGSQATEVTGSPPVVAEEDSPIDVRTMVETFNLGFRNLLEVWGLVLPPVTLVELKRLTRLPADAFRMPDETWARIVYDFALAYRLRNISRVHLLGALTPLYLGWAASHVLEVGRMRARDAELRVERLARVFEENKPYLLSRWRWPDRFNP